MLLSGLMLMSNTDSEQAHLMRRAAHLPVYTIHANLIEPKLAMWRQHSERRSFPRSTSESINLQRPTVWHKPCATSSRRMKKNDAWLAKYRTRLINSTESTVRPLSPTRKRLNTHARDVRQSTLATCQIILLRRLSLLVAPATDCRTLMRTKTILLVRITTSKRKIEEL
jgi:hypothetical protein